MAAKREPFGSVIKEERALVAKAREKHGFEQAFLLRGIVFREGKKVHVVAGPSDRLFDARVYRDVPLERMETSSSMLLIGKKDGAFHLVHGQELIDLAGIVCLSHPSNKCFRVASEEHPGGKSYALSSAAFEPFLAGMPQNFFKEYPLTGATIGACITHLKQHFGVSE